MCSQNDEDVRVWRALRDVERPTYVEVGAQHPFVMSPTAALYRLGWRGILVEPDPLFAALLREHRPDDVVIEAGASSVSGELAFARFEGTGLSTFSDEYAELASNRGFAASSTAKVPMRTLDDILTTQDLETVHFLSVDVEGWEHEVLLGANLAKWRPWVISVEAIAPGGDQYVGGLVREMLESAQYRYATFDGVNDWFVAEEHERLLPTVSVGFSATDTIVHGWRRQEAVELDAARQELDAARHFAVERESALDATITTANRLSGELASVENALATERRYLEAKRRLVAEARAIPAPLTADQAEAHPLSNVEPTPVLDKPANKPLSIRVARRLAKLVVPATVRRHVHERRNFRRFVSNYTAPEFIVTNKGGRGVRTVPIADQSIPAAFLSFEPVDEATTEAINQYLRDHPDDLDPILRARIDGANDRRGAVLSDLRCRADLARLTPRPTPTAAGTAILFDARALQSFGYRDRGIGVFSRSLLAALREAAGDRRIVLFTDLFEEPLEPGLAAGIEQISSLNTVEIGDFGLFVQPSPMTHDVAPLRRILGSGATSAAVVYDFIPGDYPEVYLRAAPDRLRYATQLQALAFYSSYLPISSAVEASLHRWVPSSLGNTTTAWPTGLVPSGRIAFNASARADRIVIFGANEPRKNTLAALAGVERATRSRKKKPEIVILGMSAYEDVARHWVGLAQLSNEHVVVAPRVSDAERDEILARSSLVLVPSFAEGLSLPVIESLVVGTPVVASDIDVHRELLGAGGHLAHPARPEEWCAAISRALRRPAGLFAQQARAFARQRKTPFEAIAAVMIDRLDASRRGVGDGSAARRGLEAEPAADHASAQRALDRPIPRTGTRLSIGVATPWPLQQSGVADYSLETLSALSRIVDLTVYATSSASPTAEISLRSMPEAYENFASHDAFVSVLGNSAFHLPMMQLLRHSGGVALAHDSRMVEFYASLLGPDRVANLLNRAVNSDGIRRSYAEQVRDNHYGNLGFAEIARDAHGMLFHSHGAASRVREEAGGRVGVLPFVPLRTPSEHIPLEEGRRQSRRYLGFRDGSVHVISLGIIHPQIKLNDLILEAALWLRMWGHDLHLHFVGSNGVDPGVVQSMIERSVQGGADWFHVTGYVSEVELRHYLSAADLAVQLRAMNVPMMSAPVADAAAYGTPTLASELLMEDDALPSFVSAVDDALSPLTLAERIASTIAQPLSFDARDEARRAYLSVRNPERYARLLLERLEEFS